MTVVMLRADFQLQTAFCHHGVLLSLDPSQAQNA
jgi:hypothetical protein